MFDSENIPLSTRVEAGPGITLTYGTNSDGEGIYTASLDSDYVGAIVTNNSQGHLTLSTTDEARLKAVETALGIGVTSPAVSLPNPAIAHDSDAAAIVAASVLGETLTFDGVDYNPGDGVSFIHITFGDGVALLSGDIISKFQLKDQSNVEIAGWTATYTASSTEQQVRLALWAQMMNEPAITSIADKLKVVGEWVVLDYNAATNGSEVDVQLISSTTADGVTWSVINY